MNLNWNLDSLYKGFDEDYKNDIKKLESSIEELNDFVSKELDSSNSIVNTIEKYLDINEKLDNLITRLYYFASLTVSTNTNHKEANKHIDIIGQILTKTTKPVVLFERFISKVENLDELASSSNKINANLFHLNELKNNSKHLLSEEEEVLYSKLRQYSSQSWSKIQQKLTSNLMIDIELDDKSVKMPLSKVRNLAYSNDADTRKYAYEKELGAYPNVETSVAMAISNIKREVNTMSELRGFDSPLHQTLFKSRMNKETLDAMISAMKEYLPEFRRYLKSKAKYLGHEGSLPFYDLFAPIGEFNKTYTYEEGKKIVEDNFRSFSNKLADFAVKAFNNNWIDVEPKEGKSGGAFCANIQMIKESRILMNYTGSFSDVLTLAHELGHGYHGDVISNETSFNWRYPMPLAETASILCETIVESNIINTLNDEEALSVLESSLMGSTQVIVDILSRYFFESNLFDETKQIALSPDVLSDMMLDAQKEAYGDGLDENYLHKYMWINKSHYYSSGLSFYNFPYAFGLLFGKGLYAQYLKDKDGFVNKYDQMLSATGKMSIEDVASMMNIDVTQADFWKSSLEIIKEEIDKFCILVEKKQ